MTDARQRAALVSFFRHRILPLTEGATPPLRAPRPPEGAADSLYHSRGGERPGRASLEIDLGSRRAIARSLDAQWRGTPLAGLGRALLRLARRFPRGAERSEVSSDVYEMF